MFRANLQVKKWNANGKNHWQLKIEEILNDKCEKKFVHRFVVLIFLIDCRHHFFQEERETEHFVLPGGVITQAEPRPQMYAPNDDADIQVARPYGSHPPFKPRFLIHSILNIDFHLSYFFSSSSEPGANMRHIRKPNPKPIEI